MSTPAAALPSFGGFAASGGLFLWVNTSGKPCPGPRGGCEARNGVKNTLADWIARGLPRTGWSYCRHRCHCVLLPMIPFGLSVDDTLDVEGASVEPEDSIAPPSKFDASKPFSEQGPVDPDTLFREVDELPLVGQLRHEADALLAQVREGKISMDEFKAGMDDMIADAKGTPRQARLDAPPEPPEPPPVTVAKVEPERLPGEREGMTIRPSTREFAALVEPWATSPAKREMLDTLIGALVNKAINLKTAERLASKIIKLPD